MQVTSEVLQFRGTHFAFGLYQAERLAGYMEKRRGMQELLGRRFTVEVATVKGLLMRFAPGLVEEIHGLQEGLGLTEQAAYLAFGGYYEDMRSGCSILFGEDFFVRNYDQTLDSYDERYVLFQPTDGYASIGPSMQVTGRTDGLNECGLVVGYNFVNTRGQGDGFVCNMIGRMLLETCQNVDEAVTLLEQLPHKHSFNYCLMDASGARAIVEATPRKVVVRTDMACTNHFRLQTAENRYTMADSVKREAVLTDLAVQQPSLQEAYRLLNDVDGGVFATKYDAWDGTLHTAAYYPHSLTAMIAIGANTRPMPFDFRGWLAGEALLVTKLKGDLPVEKG